ncbi:xanthosine phosphorylase [Escherichia coli KOEGE 71 (186a)]|nr:xanthosine phosphorylase [Escherichia coli KOEGE 71 (186a)]
MNQSHFSQNPWYCADIIRRHKPDFTPRVAFILGSGLGALAEQIEDAVAISYTDLPGFPVSTVHGHAGELILGVLSGVPVACMKGRGHFYEGRGMTVMTDAIQPSSCWAVNCCSVLTLQARFAQKWGRVVWWR